MPFDPFDERAWASHLDTLLRLTGGELVAHDLEVVANAAERRMSVRFRDAERAHAWTVDLADDLPDPHAAKAGEGSPEPFLGTFALLRSFDEHMQATVRGRFVAFDEENSMRAFYLPRRSGNALVEVRAANGLAAL